MGMAFIALGCSPRTGSMTYYGVTYGDSITFGLGIINELSQLTQKHWKNSGVGGERTDQILARWSTGITAYSPTLLIVSAGTNDLYQNVAIATIESNYQSIINNINSAGYQVCYLSAPPGASTLERVSTFNTWLNAQCPGKVFNYNQWITDNPSHRQADQIHPVEMSGYTKLAQDVWTFIKQQ